MAEHGNGGEKPEAPQHKMEPTPQQEQKPGTSEITPPAAEKAPEKIAAPVTTAEQLPLPAEGPVSEKPSAPEPVLEEKAGGALAEKKPSPPSSVGKGEEGAGEKQKTGASEITAAPAEKAPESTPEELSSVSDVAGRPQQKVVAPAEQLPLPPEEPVSEEKAGGASAEKKPSPPSSVGKEEKVQEGAGDKSRARLLWDRLRAGVRRRFHRAKTKTPLTPEEGKASHKEEEEGPPGSTPAGEQTDAAFRPPHQSVKKLQRAINLVQHLMSWYNRHRSPTEQGKGGGTTAERREPATPPGRDKGKGDRAQEESQAVGGEPDAAAARPVKKFQRAVRTKVLRILSWYNRHRSSRPKDDEPSAGQPPLAAEEEDGKKPTAAAAEEDGKKDSKTKPGPDTEEGGSDPGKPHRKWKEEEKRLEGILEEAFTRLLAPEYKRQLNATKRKCLLTFSVFELDSKVKKQAMMYWWVAQFHLPYRSDLRAKNEDALDGEGFVAKICSQLRLPYHRRSSDLPNNNTSAPGTSTTTAAPAARNDLPAAPPDQAAAHDDKKPHAEGGDVSKLPGLGSILPHRRSGDHPRNKNSAAPGNAAARDDGDAEKVLIKLSDLGFLEPIKNYCCEVIHGCKVNPLVHWMVKRLARDDAFAELDEDGRPTTTQATSGILCLTAGYRSKLQKRRIAELQAGNVPKSTAQVINKHPYALLHSRLFFPSHL